MILGKILKYKKAEVASAKRRLPLAPLKNSVSKLAVRKPGRFARALRRRGRVQVIAEIKRKSPSKGILRKDFSPVTIAKAYERAGAAAISVLTDKRFFGGSSGIFKRVRKAVDLPLLRKEFILDVYQVYESRLLGADAILLIAGALSAAKLRSLSKLAAEIGLDVLFEVHDRRELKKIAPLRPALIGVNNRDLKTFAVDIRTTERLLPFMPRSAGVVSESGIASADDLRRLGRQGVCAVLVGETLMRERDIEAGLRKLLGGARG